MFLRSSKLILRSIKALGRLPGSISEAETTLFSMFIASWDPVPALPSDPYETLRGRTNFKLRAFARHDKNNAKSFRKRIRQRSVHQVRSGTAPESSGSVPGPARGGFWPVPRSSGPAPDAPRSVLRPFSGVLDLSRARPGASPKQL